MAASNILLARVAGAAAGGETDFPVILGTTAGGSLDGTYSLPSGIANGDGILMLVRARLEITDFDGFSVLDSRTATQFMYALWKVADGTEGTSGAFAPTSSEWISYNVYHIEAGTFIGTPEALWAGTVTEDPPELTPSWGSAKTLWLAGVSLERGTPEFTGAPSGYSSLIQGESEDGNTNNNHSVTASARKEAEASADDPGTFTHNDAGATNYAAVTAAIQGG